MAHRLQVPLAWNHNSPLSIPFLEDSGKTVEEKCSWINKFNTSKKQFGLNDWKNARKQERLSQMLPEAMFIELYQNMYYWDEGDELWEHESTYYEEPPEDFFIAPEDDYPDWIDEDGVPHWGVDEE